MAKAEKPPLEVRLDILQRMTEGESLRSICRTPGYPSASAVIQWGYNDPEWSKQYAQAREAQADALFEDLAEVAELALQAETAVEVAARRLVVDTHKWRLAKIVPKKYGEKQVLEHSGVDGAPIASVLNITSMTDEQLRVLSSIPINAE